MLSSSSSSSSSSSLHTRIASSSTNGRIAFYHVCDVLQSLDIRNRRFNAIALHCNGSEFDKYAVFVVRPVLKKDDQQCQQGKRDENPERHLQQDQEIRPHPQSSQNARATYIYYDRVHGSFFSDGAYHDYRFDPDSAMSVENAHIANERFAFYKINNQL